MAAVEKAYCTCNNTDSHSKNSKGRERLHEKPNYLHFIALCHHYYSVNLSRKYTFLGALLLTILPPKRDGSHLHASQQVRYTTD